MALTCLACGKELLENIDQLELGPDGSNDENTLKTISCSNCSFVGVATYRESRRGKGESWSHFGFGTTPEVFADVCRAIRSCPTPSDSSCHCGAHQRFGTHNELGNIDATASIPAIGPRGDLG